MFGFINVFQKYPNIFCVGVVNTNIQYIYSYLFLDLPHRTKSSVPSAYFSA